MRIYLAGALLLGMLSAGCSSDPDPAIAGNTDKATQADAATLPTTALASRSGAANFASLPDRGELLRYSTVRKPERKGAYTSHPVDISEAHALNAITSGHLRLNGPDGKPIDVRFDRIEEHPDGNWTWVGQNDTGEHAVLTFGERAVFGEIFAGGRSLRVNTINGSSWVVETNPALLAGTNRGQRQAGPDFLMAPPAGGGIDTGRAMAGSKATATAVQNAKAGAVVDVLLGYTNGLATQYGGASEATSLVTSLVAQTNAAYQRSGVSMRVRLVSTLQVTYADNTDNADALQQLTGYNADTGQPTTPNSAFNALRAAREEFGADLVSLVRQHRSPEQDGCGIAWLLGAEQSGIVASDAPFGYSVVSYGQDIDEADGITYFCSDYSLAHELGHNMGQQHNTEDSEYDGVHAYSHGYRESSSTGFYTIMAYPQPDGSQSEVPYFATPLINFAAGRPLGVANQADNVRSLNLTMPIVGSFRATVVPVTAPPNNDMNADSRSDALWWNPGTRQFSYTLMNGRVAGTSRTYTYSAGWTVAAVGDFNGDGLSDLISVNTAARQYQVGLNTGTAFTWTDLGAYGAGWQITGAADITGDGKDDILWWNANTRQFSYTVMNGASAGASFTSNYSSGWTVPAVGDFDGDGRVDLISVNASTREYQLGRSTGSGFTWTRVGFYSAGWQIIYAADINADSKADIIWWNPTTRQMSYTLMNGASGGASYTFNYSPGWTVAAVGDFDGDGRADLISVNATTREYQFGKSAGTGFTWSRIGTYSAGWSLLMMW